MPPPGLLEHQRPESEPGGDAAGGDANAPPRYGPPKTPPRNKAPPPILLPAEVVGDSDGDGVRDARWFADAKAPPSADARIIRIAHERQAEMSARVAERLAEIQRDEAYRSGTPDEEQTQIDRQQQAVGGVAMPKPSPTLPAPTLPPRRWEKKHRCPSEFEPPMPATRKAPPPPLHPPQRIPRVQLQQQDGLHPAPKESFYIGDRAQRDASARLALELVGSQCTQLSYRSHPTHSSWSGATEPGPNSAASASDGMPGDAAPRDAELESYAHYTRKHTVIRDPFAVDRIEVTHGNWPCDGFGVTVTMEDGTAVKEHAIWDTLWVSSSGYTEHFVKLEDLTVRRECSHTMLRLHAPKAQPLLRFGNQAGKDIEGMFESMPKLGPRNAGDYIVMHYKLGIARCVQNGREYRYWYCDSDGSAGTLNDKFWEESCHEVGWQSKLVLPGVLSFRNESRRTCFIGPTFGHPAVIRNIPLGDSAVIHGDVQV